MIDLRKKPLCFGSGGCSTDNCPYKVRCVYQWIQVHDAKIAKLAELVRG